MSAHQQSIKALTIDQSNKVPKEYKELHKVLLQHRQDWQDNPCYLTGIQYSFHLATFKAGLKALTEQLGDSIDKETLDLISYENHMCEQYWRELVDGPMLASQRRSRLT